MHLSDPSLRANNYPQVASITPPAPLRLLPLDCFKTNSRKEQIVLKVHFRKKYNSTHISYLHDQYYYVCTFLALVIKGSILNYENKTKQKQTHRYREQTDGCGGEGEGMGEKVKGLRSTNC